VTRSGGIVFALALAFASSLAFAEKYDDKVSFDHPAGWKAEAVADISTENAVRLTAPAGKQPLKWALVLMATKKVADGDMETEAAAWHAAHVKNRSAWGMKSEGGTPRELTRVAGKRAIRYRDQVGSALGANEQTLTCTLVSARLACVIVAGSAESRDNADALISQILSTLQTHKR
jgi:hypothetical protein